MGIIENNTVNFCRFCQTELTDKDKVNSEVHCEICRKHEVPYSHKEYQAQIIFNNKFVWAICEFISIGQEQSTAKCYIDGDYIKNITKYNYNFRDASIKYFNCRFDFCTHNIDGSCAELNYNKCERQKRDIKKYPEYWK